jgi:hypothetical protein
MGSVRATLVDLIDGGIGAGDPRYADAGFMRRVRTANACTLGLISLGPGQVGLAKPMRMAELVAMLERCGERVAGTAARPSPPAPVVC